VAGDRTGRVYSIIELSDDDDQRLSSQLIEDEEDKEDVTKRVKNGLKFQAVSEYMRVYVYVCVFADLHGCNRCKPRSVQFSSAQLSLLQSTQSDSLSLDDMYNSRRLHIHRYISKEEIQFSYQLMTLSLL